MLVYSKLDKNKIKIKHCISVAANCAGAVYDVCCFFYVLLLNDWFIVF
jgi:hypothetical protein